MWPDSRNTSRAPVVCTVSTTPADSNPIFLTCTLTYSSSCSLSLSLSPPSYSLSPPPHFSPDVPSGHPFPCSTQTTNRTEHSRFRIPPFTSFPNALQKKNPNHSVSSSPRIAYLYYTSIMFSSVQVCGDGDTECREHETRVCI